MTRGSFERFRLTPGLVSLKAHIAKEGEKASHA